MTAPTDLPENPAIEPGQEDPLDIPAGFIEENKAIKLGKTRQKSGGPYTKVERTKRRKEVYRLHFEYGMAASEIAEHMNVNRNTIMDDIRLLYREIAKDSPEYHDYYNKMEQRLEATRQRVLSYLSSAVSVEEKLGVERLAAEIDFRLLNAATKMEYSDVTLYDKAVRLFNNTAKKHGWDYRGASMFEIQKISTWAHKDFHELYHSLGRKSRLYNDGKNGGNVKNK